MSPRKRFTARVTQAFAATGLPRTLAVRAATADSPSEILLYDEIGFWGVTATDFAAALKDAGPGQVNVRINSPGGDVFDGLAIYNMLLAHPGGVNTMVDGLAASAASYIAMAGDTVSMAESSQMMIHNAWGVAIGNRHDMTKTSDVLGRIDGQLADIYVSRTGKDKADVTSMMDAETWMTASEAKDSGFCNTVVTPKAKASADGAKELAGMAIRRAFRDATANEVMEVTPEFVEALRAALPPTRAAGGQETIADEKSPRQKRLRLARIA